jgi:hypothetical protein
VTHLHWLLTSPAAGVERLLFLFNAAFVKPLYKPMQERHLQAGLKVYGCSQLMTQQMPRDHGGAYGQKSMGLPCFNAASAYTTGALGKAHWLALQCLVLGAGLAGAACAASLARRGWQLTVLDAQGAAHGASALPAVPKAASCAVVVKSEEVFKFVPAFAVTCPTLLVPVASATAPLTCPLASITRKFSSSPHCKVSPARRV